MIPSNKKLLKLNFILQHFVYKSSMLSHQYITLSGNKFTWSKYTINYTKICSTESQCSRTVHVISYNQKLLCTYVPPSSPVTFQCLVQRDWSKLQESIPAVKNCIILQVVQVGT
jgi:hypothetical protein